jgi:arsenate reductase (thioredoxin)
MAHGILQSFDPNLRVCSAGTAPAQQVHPLAVQVMSEWGLDIRAHLPKMVDLYSQEAWDFVVTVCGQAEENCPTFTGEVKKRLHIGFEDPALAQGTQEEILEVFRKVRTQILSGFFAFYHLQVK